MEKLPYLGTCLSLSLVALLAGCGGGGGGGGGDDDGGGVDSGGAGSGSAVAKSGIYRGTIGTNAAETPSTIILSTSGNTAELVERADRGTYASGSITFNDSGFSGPITEFVGTEKSADGTIAGTSTATTLSGEGSTSSATISSFEFERFNELSDLPARLSNVSGIWSEGATAQSPITTTLTIGADGIVQDGSDTYGCSYTGNVSIPDSSVNVYKVVLTATSCQPDADSGYTAEQLNGTYSGYGFYVPGNDDSGNEFFVFVDNNQVNRYLVLDQAG